MSTEKQEAFRCAVISQAARKTSRENDFATLKQVIEAVGPCAMAIEELNTRLNWIEEELGKRQDQAEAVSKSLQNSSTSPETP